MNKSMVLILATPIFLAPSSGFAGEAAYPLEVSENGRYFLTRKASPSSGWARPSGSSSGTTPRKSRGPSF